MVQKLSMVVSEKIILHIRDWVHDAIKYAASKDVLIMHAAGNDSKNIDYRTKFSNRRNKWDRNC